MRRLFYPSGSVLTGDAISQALLEYAEALSVDGRSDIVDFPVLLPSGVTGSATMLIGPTSQLATVTEESEVPDPVDADLIADLGTRRQRMATSASSAQGQYADFLSAHEEYE